MIKRLLVVLMLGLLTLMPISAWADAKVTLETKALVEVKAVDDKGQEVIKLVPAADAAIVPGDVVIFTITFSNKGDESTDPGLVISNPVPAHMQYIGKTASGKGAVITFSVDEGKVYDVPEKLSVRGADGKKRKAMPSEYTHIKWVIKSPLRPGTEGSVGFRARLK